MRKRGLVSLLVVSGVGLLVVAGWQGQAQSPPTSRLGDPLPGLTAAQRTAFEEGKTKFLTVEEFEDGLGPVFNGRSCGECHSQGAAGGAGFDLIQSRVTRIGGVRNGVYSDLPELGGPVIERRSIEEFFADCPIEPEVVPPTAEYISHRITTPLFGLGLIEAIPTSEILRNADPFDWNHDGISGRANLVLNPETQRYEVGRFGWKCQVSSLHVFAGDAYLNEMGITSATFPNENLPQGQTFDPIWDPKADPEEVGDPNDIDRFTTFMRLLAPPPRKAETHQVRRGEETFEQLRCIACHVPLMTTGANAIAALAHKRVPLYSDLLLHDMGSEFNDGIQQGSAGGGEWRTAPLWGVSGRQFFLHDGRATTIDAAIRMHGGEAKQIRQRYITLSADKRAELLAFLNSL